MRLIGRRKAKDRHLETNFGKRGPCAICQKYSDLSFDHVPPKCMGNNQRVDAVGYMTALSTGWDQTNPRRFKKGLGFYSLCRDCNNRLGTQEDLELAKLYQYTNLLMRLPFYPGPRSITLKPNQLYRGLLAHLLAANDSGFPDPFDDEAREILNGTVPCNQTKWNLYYWPYFASEIFLLRSAFLGVTNANMDLHWIFMLKIAPWAFLFSKDDFLNLPNVRAFLTNDDQQQVAIPIDLSEPDFFPVWPATPGDTLGQIVFAGENTFGVLAKKVSFMGST